MYYLKNHGLNAPVWSIQRILTLTSALLCVAIICFLATHIPPTGISLSIGGIHSIANESSSRHTLHSLIAANEANGIVVSPPPPPADTEGYVGICLLVKDDAPLLHEYLVHHYYHHGIRHFYIYDDGSPAKMSKGGREIVQYIVPRSALTFEYIEPDAYPNGPERAGLQETIMNRCIDLHGPKHTWLGLFDIDEFINMQSSTKPNLIEYLKEWETQAHVGAVAISSLPHNSANLTEIPSAGFRRSYTSCVSSAEPGSWSRITQLKNFLRPDLVQKIANIHSVAFTPEAEARGVIRVDELGKDVPTANADIRSQVSRHENTTWEYIALHHYGTGSKEYFRTKQERGRIQGEGMFVVDENYWNDYHKDVEEVKCEAMANFRP